MTDRAAPVFSKTDASSPSFYPPSQTALILGDFQAMPISMTGAAGQATIPTAAALRTWAAQHNVLIIHTIIDLSGPPPAPTSKLAARWAGMTAMAAANPSLTEEVAAIANADDVTVKRGAGLISALTSPEVRDLLAARQVKSLIVAGVTSTGVVLSTARAAYDEGYVVTAVEDACADRTENVHEVIMREVLVTSHVATAEVVKAELEAAWAS